MSLLINKIQSKCFNTIIWLLKSTEMCIQLEIQNEDMRERNRKREGNILGWRDAGETQSNNLRSNQNVPTIKKEVFSDAYRYLAL